MKTVKNGKNLKTVLILSGIIISFGLAVSQNPAATDSATELSEEERAALIADSIARADSIALAESRKLADAALDKYKQLKFIQYDGVTQDVLYPEAMSVYRSVLDAYAAPKVEEDNIKRFKGIMADLHPLFLKGALFYSSAGKSDEMAKFATVYVDMHKDQNLGPVSLTPEGQSLYPALVYSAASSAYNRGDYMDAIDYFEEYLGTDASDRREQVSLFLGQACINAKCPERGHRPSYRGCRPVSGQHQPAVDNPAELS